MDLKVGPDGALYYLARGAGYVGAHLLHRGSSPRRSQLQPVSRTVGVGQSATFSVGAKGARRSRTNGAEWHGDYRRDRGEYTA